MKPEHEARQAARRLPLPLFCRCRRARDIGRTRRQRGDRIETTFKREIDRRRILSGLPPRQCLEEVFERMVPKSPVTEER
jgi:hypothetical protein